MFKFSDIQLITLGCTFYEMQKYGENFIKITGDDSISYVSLPLLLGLMYLFYVLKM